MLRLTCLDCNYIVTRTMPFIQKKFNMLKRIYENEEISLNNISVPGVWDS